MSKPNQRSERIDKDVQAHLRKLVADYRDEQGLSRTKFADRVGMSLWMISMFENGDRSLSLEGAIRVCNALDRKLWEVLRDIDERR